MNAPDRLAAKVRAVNRAHQIAREIYPRLLEAMRPFIGSKVYTVNGALLAKVEKALPDLPHENGPGGGVMVYRYTSTLKGLKAAERLKANGWMIDLVGFWTIQFYKLF